MTKRQRDYKKEAFTSEFAFRILQLIKSHGDTDYPTKIAEELDSQPQTISNYLKAFRELDIVEKKEKEGRKRRYGFNHEGVRNLWKTWYSYSGHRNLDYSFHDGEKTDYTERVEEEYPVEVVQEFYEPQRTIIPNPEEEIVSGFAEEFYYRDAWYYIIDSADVDLLLDSWIDLYFDNVEESSLKRMLVDDFQRALHWIYEHEEQITEKSNFPEVFDGHWGAELEEFLPVWMDVANGTSEIYGLAESTMIFTLDGMARRDSMQQAAEELREEKKEED